jgi:acetylornithine deacetylase
MDLFRLTKKLIDLKSPTGKENEVVSFLSEYLNNIGLEIKLQTVSPDRQNILAFKGEPSVVLSTHTDTVSPYFPYSEDERYIYGRGACDTKGIIAAQLKAAEMLIKNNISNFGLLFVVGEEAESDGAIAANRLPNNCKYLINGEPTGNKIALGSKGSLRVKITTKGKAAHSAYPQQGESAIEKLIDILNDIRNLPLPVDKILGETNFNIGLISGGVQANVIPAHAETLLMFRIVNSICEIKRLIESVIKCRGEVEYIFGCEPVLMKTLTDFDTMVAAFTTDIPNLNNWGEPLLIGPGSILDAHTDHEKISKKELKEAVGIYYKIITRLISEVH